MNKSMNTRELKSRGGGYWLVALALAATAQSAFGGGYRLPDQDPEAIARGNAFAATADNPSAIYYNPAGITQIPDLTAQAGFYAISMGVRYTSATGADAHTKTTPQPVPEFYAVAPLKDTPFSVGIGLYVPYGLSVDWGNNTSFRTISERGNLLYTTLNPVIAWQVLPSLSIAAGPTLNYSKIKLEKGILPAAFNTTDQFRFVGDDFDAGFNAGILWHPHEMVSLGFTYRYLTTMKYGGHAEIHTPGIPGLVPAIDSSVPSTAEFRFPQFFTAGLSVRPTEDWNLEFDIDWTDWDNVNSVVFHGTPVGDQTFLLNYQSGFVYEFGVTRQLGKGYALNFGYFYSDNSSPDQNFNPTVPDTYLHVGSIGVSRRGERWNWAVTYNVGYNPGRQVTGSQSSPTPNPFGETADGHYKVLNQGVSASLSYRF